MGALIDLTGEVFGRLIVEGRAPNAGRRTRWTVLCECGTRKTVGAEDLAVVRSCGCLRREAVQRTGRRNRTHGMARTGTYRTFQAMLQRCHNNDHEHYDLYGGRGVVVCARWLGEGGFANFVADMGERPTGKTLDRFPDQNGNYEQANCRWATATEQARNRRTNRLLTLNGEALPVSAWSERVGIASVTILDRLRRGWTVSRALTTEVA